MDNEVMFTVTWVEQFDTGVVTQSRHGVTGWNFQDGNMTVFFDRNFPMVSEHFPVVNMANFTAVAEN